VGTPGGRALLGFPTAPSAPPATAFEKSKITVQQSSIVNQTAWALSASPHRYKEMIKAMGYSDDEANEAIRLSWCHLTPEVDCPPSGQAGCVLRTVFTEAQMRLLDWVSVAGRIKNLRQGGSGSVRRLFRRMVVLLLGK
jgi:hypothetical protein